MKKQATKILDKKNWEIYIENVKNYFKKHPRGLYITICTVAICATAFKGMTTLEAIKVADSNAILQQARSIVEVERSRTEAVRITTEASMNPYTLAAKNAESCPPPVSLTINSVDYNVGSNDGETEQNIAVTIVKSQGRKTRYNPEQRKLITLAYHVGKRIGYPETIQAILIQETRAGAYGNRIGDTNLPMGKRSYGVMQMKVATARGILKLHPSMVTTNFPARKSLKRVRDEEIIIKLIQNDVFSLQLAAFNFADHRKKSKSWSQSVVAYNTGQGAANRIKNHKEHIYYKHVLKRIINEVRPFNSHVGLTTS